jgi:hypothetical protein
MSRICLALLSLTLASTLRADVTIYTLNGDYTSTPSTPIIETYTSVASFQSGSGSTTNRSNSQGVSSDISIASNGTVYFINGNSNGTGTRTLYSWTSLANWAADTGTTTIGTRSTNAAMMGMAILNNEIYLLEGTAAAANTATLKKWTITDWVNGTAGTTLGSRNVGAGFGFEIAEDGSVWKLDSANPSTAISGTLQRWSSVTDFLNDTNLTSFAYTTGGPYAGLAVVSVPEPGTLLLGGIAAACGGTGIWWKRRKRQPQPETTEQPAAI